MSVGEDVGVTGTGAGPGVVGSCPHETTAKTNSRMVQKNSLVDVSKELPPQRRVGWFLGQVTKFHSVYHRGGSANVPRHSPCTHF